MPWVKRGLVYKPDDSLAWAHSHAYVPTPVLLNDKVIRVFLAFWDQNKYGRLGYVDVEASDPTRVLEISQRPLLEDGRPGAFDDSGVTPSCAFWQGEKLYLFYIGWQKGVEVRYFLFSGLAVSEDQGKSFTRLSEAPVLDRCEGQIYVRSAPFVIKLNEIWHLFYIGGNEWIESAGKQVPSYDIYRISSANPLQWEQKPTLILASQKEQEECGLGRPWLIYEEGRFKMWYSIRYRNSGYAAGYAESPNGVDWTSVKDLQTLLPSKDGWDSEMVCFNAVIDVQDRRFMFYNGNNFGETGFGVAEWSS